MNEYGHIVRCIPNSINEIYEQCKDKVDKFYIIDRDGSVIWYSKSEGLPGNILNEIINKDYTLENKNNDVKWAVISYERESLGLRFNYNQENELNGKKLIA